MEIAQNFMGPGAKKTMARINDNGNVVGTIIVNCEGFPETTTLDSLTAATYSTHMRNLSHHANNALKEVVRHPFTNSKFLIEQKEARNVDMCKTDSQDVTDQLMVLRLVSKKTEAVVVPDNEFHLIVVMRRR